jgi:enoyl-CoA hydratase/carnithine racemase
MTTWLDTGTDRLLVEIQDGIAVVTFNHPEKHNAPGCGDLLLLRD